VGDTRLFLFVAFQPTPRLCIAEDRLRSCLRVPGATVGWSRPVCVRPPP
jgi:hypothetical protein